MNIRKKKSDGRTVPESRLVVVGVVRWWFCTEERVSIGGWRRCFRRSEGLRLMVVIGNDLLSLHGFDSVSYDRDDRSGVRRRLCGYDVVDLKGGSAEVGFRPLLWSVRRVCVALMIVRLWCLCSSSCNLATPFSSVSTNSNNKTLETNCISDG